MLAEVCRFRIKLRCEVREHVGWEVVSAWSARFGLLGPTEEHGVCGERRLVRALEAGVTAALSECC